VSLSSGESRLPQTPMRIIVISSIRLYRDGLALALSQLDDVAEVVSYSDGAQGFLDGRQSSP